MSFARNLPDMILANRVSRTVARVRDWMFAEIRVRIQHPPKSGSKSRVVASLAWSVDETREAERPDLALPIDGALPASPLRGAAPHRTPSADLTP